MNPADKHNSMPIGSPRNDLSGQRFSRLTVRGNPRSYTASCGVVKHVYWECDCDCGGKAFVRTTNLNTKQVKSCGCLQDEARTKHGLSKAHVPTYNSWNSMRGRSTNPNVARYADYGAKGIGCCDRWADFGNFYADMGERPEGTTLDRIDNSVGYEPDNCRWSTYKEQVLNRDVTVFIEYDGRKQTLSDWASEVGISPITLRGRIKRGWTVEDAINLKPDVTRRYKRTIISFNGKSLMASEWDRELGLGVNVVNARIRSGWSVERALTTPKRPKP